MVNKNKIKIQKINDFAKAGNLKIVKKVLEPEAEKEKTKIEKARIEKIKTQNFKNNFKNKDEPIKDLKPEAWRYVILFSFIILAFLYLFWTLFKVQILENKKYADLREKQYKLLTQNTENRGTIYGKDKNGEIIPLAINKKEYKLVLSPKDLDQNYLTIIYNLVNKITPIDNADFLKSATKKNDAYEEIKDLTNDEAEKIKNLKVNGVSVAEKEERFYPLKNVASQVVGFIGDGEGGIKGRYGLEKYYNDILQKNQINKNSFFAALFKDLNDGNFNNKNEEIGKSLNIVTTLEPNVMNYLNAELQNIYTQWSPDMAAGIIMDTKTGEILAMDSIPSFDPNNYKDSSTKNFNNPNVQGIYELGSIMKPITVSGGIENGLINPETIYHDAGSVIINGFKIQNYDKRAWGDMTVQGALEHSLNLGMIFIMRKMGFDKFRENLLNFKLSEETGIDLPGEVSNQIQNIFGKTEVNYATASFGQGIATSPISMLRALNTIANNGKIVNPHILKQQLDEEDNIFNIIFTDKEDKKAVSEETAKTVKSMMVKSLDNFASGKYKDLKYGVGVKTGTGQIAKPGGGYYEDRTLHSYFAFFPEKDSRFSVLIFQVNPKRGQSSSETLTAHIQNIKNFLLTYYLVSPER